MLSGEVDDAANRGDERRIVVILIDPLSMGDFVDVVIARGLLVELDSDVLFVDLHLGDVFHRPRVQHLGMRRLSGLARIVSQIDEVDRLHNESSIPAPCGYGLREAPKMRPCKRLSASIWEVHTSPQR